MHIWCYTERNTKEGGNKPMKKALTLITLATLLLTGCSSGGVPQEQYESVVAERDEYKAKLESISSLFDTDTDSNADVVEEDSEKDDSSPEKVNLLENGWTSYKNGDYSHIRYAVKIENPNAGYAVEFPTITITAKDADGKILSTDERVLNSIAADDTIYYGDEISYEGEEPTTVDISVSNNDRNFEKQDDSEYVKQSDFVVSNISENVGSYNTKYTGEVTNNSSVDFDTVAVIIIYKQSEKIVGGDIEYVDDLMAGATKPFELSADSDMKQYDGYDFYAIQW